MDKKHLFLLLALTLLSPGCLFEPTGSEETEVAKEPKGSPIPKNLPRTRLNVAEEQFIIDRRPFGLGEEKVAKPTTMPRETPTPRVEAPPISNKRFSLLGTVAAGTSGWAVIVDGQSNKEGLYRAGSYVVVSVKLLSVERNRALLQNGRRKFYITSQKGGGIGSGGPAPTPQRPPAEAPPVQTGFGQAQRQTITLANTDIANNMKNLSRLFSQIRFAPYFEAGRQQGFKILNVRRGSFPERIGAQKGDIVQAVNGKALTSVRSAFDIFRGVKDEPTVSLSLLRQGKPFIIDLQRR